MWELRRALATILINRQNLAVNRLLKRELRLVMGELTACGYEQTQHVPPSLRCMAANNAEVAEGIECRREYLVSTVAILIIVSFLARTRKDRQGS